MLRIFTIVVSYNRKILLERCLQSLAAQSLSPERILVVDNSSTDGTAQWLRDWLPGHLPTGELVALRENTGGAGGFSEGLSKACSAGADWIWMMDDDAAPYPNALEELMKIADDPRNVYGSLAVNGDDTAWATTLLDDAGRVAFKANEVPGHARVQSLPFLGFLIHRSLVEKIGLPDVGFFIAADDVEYCVRAQRAGANLVIAGNSRIEHPKTQGSMINVLGVPIAYLSLPPWKRYYDTRNRLLIARKHYGYHLFTQTIPGSVVRLLASLLNEPRRLAQLWAFTAGFIDGVLGIKGKRHHKWGIPQ